MPTIEIVKPDLTLPLERRLEIAVAMLPDNSLEIARLLRDLGIKGQRGRASGCPLSAYFRQALDMSEVSVFNSVFVSGYSANSWPFQRESVQTDSTDAMVQFIRWFDNPTLGHRRLRRKLLA